MDQQFKIIRTKSWYPFVKDSILPSLREVVVKYSAIVERIIPQEETYRNYKEGLEGYADGTGLMPYQAYHLMNRLYAERDWTGLEKIAKAAFESNNSDMQQLACRWTKYVKFSEKGDTLRNDSTGKIMYGIKRSNDYLRPYALAAYYLSECYLHRGYSDTKLLSHFIDDSNAGLEFHKTDNGGQVREWWNDENIVLNQIRMYIQSKNYEGAKQIAISHLPNDPKYEILFKMLDVLDCGQKKPENIEAIAKTSPMNAVAIYLAQDEDKYFLKADSVIRNDSTLSFDDPMVLYAHAICRFRTECETARDEDAKSYQPEHLYDPNDELPLKDGKKQDWAAPMLEAIKLDQKNAEYLKNDGYFNDAYGLLVLYFWKRIQDGELMDTICNEYKTLQKEANTQEQNKKK